MNETGEPDPSDSDGRFVAFLRGINVGGHHKIKMTDLARMFEEMGHRDVCTIIASGNVLFLGRERDQEALVRSIEASLLSELGYEVRVMLRSMTWLRELVRENPFVGHEAIEGHRYVSFFPEPIQSSIELPYHNVEECYSVLSFRGGDLFTISGRMPDGRHADYGKYASKVFGKVSTTRNWNTIVKIAAM